jgi:hypothetical protein
MMDGMRQDELAEIDLTEDEIDAMMAEGEPVEVSGPFDPVRRVRFELVGGGPHAYRWRIVAANGEIRYTKTGTLRFEGGTLARPQLTSSVSGPEPARSGRGQLALPPVVQPLRGRNSVSGGPTPAIPR